MIGKASGRPAAGLLDEMITEISAEAMANDRQRLMYTYWLAQGDRENLPPVSAIDPLVLPREVLAWMIVLDVEERPRRYRHRLVGTKVVEAVGIDHTGAYVDDLPGMERLLERFNWCVESRRPYIVSARITWSPRDYKIYHSLALPFAGEDGHVARLVFVLAFS